MGLVSGLRNLVVRLIPSEEIVVERIPGCPDFLVTEFCDRRKGEAIAKNKQVRKLFLNVFMKMILNLQGCKANW
jgi:hypothetical protein